MNKLKNPQVLSDPKRSRALAQWNENQVTLADHHEMTKQQKIKLLLTLCTFRLWKTWKSPADNGEGGWNLSWLTARPAINSNFLRSKSKSLTILPSTLINHSCGWNSIFKRTHFWLVFAFFTLLNIRSQSRFNCLFEIVVSSGFSKLWLMPSDCCLDCPN